MAQAERGLEFADACFALSCVGRLALGFSFTRKRASAAEIGVCRASGFCGFPLGIERRALRAVVGRLVVAVPRVLAAVLLPEGLAGRVVFAAPAELARALLALRAGATLAAAFFVGGTDLPPIWTS